MNHETTATPADEFAAIQTVHEALAPLSVEGRHRVMSYIVNLLEITAPINSLPAGSEGDDEEAEEPAGQEERSNDSEQFSTFAELHNATAPVTNADNALVAAYWLQSQGQESFGAHYINKELKHLGTGIQNVTGALKKLIDSKPALILQVRKGGKSRQARKTYKITHAGLEHVREMIRG